MKKTNALLIIGFTLTISSLLISEQVMAHESHAGSTDGIVAVKSFTSKQHGPVHVVIRNDGHVLAKPFVVEVRPQCKSQTTEWRELTVVDMESACKVDVKSLSFSEKRGTIEIEIHDTDPEDYQRRSRRAPGRVIPVCLKQPKVFTVPIASLCDE